MGPDFEESLGVYCCYGAGLVDGLFDCGVLAVAVSMGLVVSKGGGE